MLSGRKLELNLLNTTYRKNKSQFTICYGRRRIGKTTLLKEFVKDKNNAFFYSALKTTLKKQIKFFLKEFSIFVNDPLIATAACKTWKDVFDIIGTRLPSKKTIIVFDEFQWMCGNDQLLISVLQHLWDHNWQNNNKVHLILCGSSISFMLKKVLSEKSPLFGRRTQSFELKAFNCKESCSLIKHDPYHVARYTMLFGGVPAYLTLFDKKLSFEQNVNQLSLCHNAYFVNELTYVLSEQLKQPAAYYKILRNLAIKPHSLTELAKKLKTTTSSVIFNVQRLKDINIIKEHKTIFGKETSKKLLYKINDEYVRYYFTYIYPHQSLINQNHQNFIFDQITATTWNNYMGICFEDFCHKNISQILSFLNIESSFYKAGSYWHKKNTRHKQGVQIDLVIETTQRVTYICECKWSQNKISYSILDELNNKTKLYPNYKKHKLQKLLIASSGVTNNLINHPDLITMTLEDFFK